MKFQKALAHLVETRTVRRPYPEDDDETAHARHRKWFEVAAPKQEEAFDFFNGDLDSDDIIHVCPGSDCCSSDDETKKKVFFVYFVPQLAGNLFGRIWSTIALEFEL